MQGIEPVLALADILKLVLFLAIYFNRRRRFGHCMPIGYVQL